MSVIITGTCETPYLSLAGGCYQFLDITVDGNEARVICQSSRGDLAVIDDCHLMTAIIDYIRDEGQIQNARGCSSNFGIMSPKILRNLNANNNSLKHSLKFFLLFQALGPPTGLVV